MTAHRAPAPPELAGPDLVGPSLPAPPGVGPHERGDPGFRPIAWAALRSLALALIVGLLILVALPAVLVGAAGQ